MSWTWVRRLDKHQQSFRCFFRLSEIFLSAVVVYTKTSAFCDAFFVFIYFFISLFYVPCLTSLLMRLLICMTSIFNVSVLFAFRLLFVSLNASLKYGQARRTICDDDDTWWCSRKVSDWLKLFEALFRKYTRKREREFRETWNLKHKLIVMSTEAWST